MIKLIPLAETPDARDADEAAAGEPTRNRDGVDIDLDQDQLVRLAADDCPQGHEVEIAARGYVAGNWEHDGRSGARIRLTHMAIEDADPGEEPDAAEPRDNLRSEIERIHREAEDKQAEQTNQRRARTAKQIPEQTPGQ